MMPTMLNFETVPCTGLPKDVCLVDKEIMQSLTCCICLEIMTNACRGCDNEHYFCKSCLEEHQSQCALMERRTSCPTCRAYVVLAADHTAGKPLPVIDAIIKSQHCVCPNNCEQVGPLSLLNQHLKVCPKRKVPCPFSELGCVAVLTASEVQEHLESCSHEHMGLLCRSAANVSNVLSRQQTELSAAQAKSASNHNYTQLSLHAIESRVSRMEASQKEVNTVLLSTLAAIQDKLEHVGPFAAVPEKPRGKGCELLTRTVPTVPGACRPHLRWCARGMLSAPASSS